MFPLAVCPSQQQLSDYLLGKLSGDDFSLISNHLENCVDCLSRVEVVDQYADSVVRKLRQPVPEDEFITEPQCQQALVESRRLARDLKHDSVTLRDYRLCGKLGVGGMGTVYSAVHTKLEKRVAIKLLPTDRIRSPDAISRFEREMKAIGKLQHPNIVQAHDAGVADGNHCLVMELVEGMNASALVQGLGPLPLADACEIMRQAAIGLQHAHENDLVHRDVKPSNIMVTPTDEVKILDLGLARLDDALPDAGELTSSGQIMGTLDYMAPEQLGDSHAVDHRADIYSMDATLYKLLTGRAPYAETKYNTPQKKLMAIATKAATPLAEFRDEVPRKLVNVLDRMIAKDPDERFATSSEVADAFQDFSKLANLAALVREAEQQYGGTDEDEVVTTSTTDPMGHRVPTPSQAFRSLT